MRSGPSFPPRRRAQGLIEYLLLVLMVVGTAGLLLVCPFVGIQLLIPGLGTPSITLVHIAGALLIIASLSSLLGRLTIRLLRGRVSHSRSDEEAAKTGSISPLSLLQMLVQLAVGVQLVTRASVSEFSSLESTLVGALLLYPITATVASVIWKRIKPGKKTPTE